MCKYMFVEKPKMKVTKNVNCTYIYLIHAWSYKACKGTIGHCHLKRNKYLVWFGLPELNCRGYCGRRTPEQEFLTNIKK